MNREFEMFVNKYNSAKMDIDRLDSNEIYQPFVQGLELDTAKTLLEVLNQQSFDIEWMGDKIAGQAATIMELQKQREERSKSTDAFGRPL